MWDFRLPFSPSPLSSPPASISFLEPNPNLSAKPLDKHQRTLWPIISHLKSLSQQGRERQYFSHLFRVYPKLTKTKDPTPAMGPLTSRNLFFLFKNVLISLLVEKLILWGSLDTLPRSLGAGPTLSWSVCLSQALGGMGIFNSFVLISLPSLKWKKKKGSVGLTLYLFPFPLDSLGFVCVCLAFPHF